MATCAGLARFAYLGVAIVLGCSARPGSPGANDNVWRRLQTEHFDLVTDLPEADAMASTVALERTRAALLQAAWGSLRVTRRTQRIRVVVLANVWDFERYFTSHVTGIHFNIGGETIVLSGTAGNWERHTKGGEYSVSIIRHELVHHLAAGIYGRQPRWFAEGLAQFLETMVVTDQGKTAIINRPNLIAWDSYRRNRSLSVKDALGWGKLNAVDSQTTTLGLYGLSWAMVHYMRNMRSEAFTTYQQALGRGDDPDRAWAASFGADDLDEMNRAVNQYVNHGNYQELLVDLEPIEVSTVPVVVTAADIHALSAQLALAALDMNAGDQRFKEEADSHLAAALALEPGNVAALELLMRSKKVAKSELITRLRDETKRRPDEGEAWLFLGELVEGPEREAALRKAVTFSPRNAKAYNNLAYYLVETNRGEEALPLATKAALLAPWSYLVLDTYAAALFAVGRCPDAIRIQLRAVDNVPEHQRDKGGARSITETLDRYRASCPPATPAP